MRRFVPLHHVRSDFALCEFPHTPAKVLLFIGEAEFHSLLSSLWLVAIRRQKFSYNLILHERRHRPFWISSNRFFFSKKQCGLIKVLSTCWRASFRYAPAFCVLA